MTEKIVATQEMLDEMDQQFIPQQVDGLEDVESLEPVDELELESTVENEFGDYNDKYKIDKKLEFVDSNRGEVVDRKDLTPWEMIQSLAKQLGTTLLEPKKGCKNCYGRGWLGLHVETKTPIPCTCIFDKEAKARQKEMTTQLGFMNRKSKRKLQGVMTKERQAWLKKQALDKDREKQLQIKRKKKKAEKVAALSRKINRQKRK